MPETMSGRKKKHPESIRSRDCSDRRRKGNEGCGLKKQMNLQKRSRAAISLDSLLIRLIREVHRKTTGPEIWKDTDGEVDLFIAGVGTGGTLTGVGEYLKSQNPDGEDRCIGACKLTGTFCRKRWSLTRFRGIGAGFVPDVLNTTVYDEIFTVENDDALQQESCLQRKKESW